MIEDVMLIREKMRQFQDCQKSYLDKRRWDLEFEVSDKDFVRVIFYKHVMRIDKKEKLTPRFVRPFEVLERVGKVTY